MQQSQNTQNMIKDTIMDKVKIWRQRNNFSNKDEFKKVWKQIFGSSVEATVDRLTGNVTCAFSMGNTELQFWIKLRVGNNFKVAPDMRYFSYFVLKDNEKQWFNDILMIKQFRVLQRPAQQRPMPMPMPMPAPQLRPTQLMPLPMSMPAPQPRPTLPMQMPVSQPRPVQPVAQIQFMPRQVTSVTTNMMIVPERAPVMESTNIRTTIGMLLAYHRATSTEVSVERVVQTIEQLGERSIRANDVKDAPGNIFILKLVNGKCQIIALVEFDFESQSTDRQLWTMVPGSDADFFNIIAVIQQPIEVRLNDVLVDDDDDIVTRLPNGEMFTFIRVNDQIRASYTNARGYKKFHFSDDLNDPKGQLVLANIVDITQQCDMLLHELVNENFDMPQPQSESYHAVYDERISGFVVFAMSYLDGLDNFCAHLAEFDPEFYSNDSTGFQVLNQDGSILLVRKI